MMIINTGTRAGNVIQEAEQIEPVVRTEWVPHFSAPPPNRIDPLALQEVNLFHANNPQLTTPLPIIDLDRLQSNSPLLKPFKPAQVFHTLIYFKDRAPGPDTIRKIHIVHFLKLLFVILTQLFNYALATGYYPQYFKNGIMIFIPKSGKDPSHPKNDQKWLVDTLMDFFQSLLQ